MRPNRARPGNSLSGIDSATFDLIEEYNLQDKVRIHMIGLGKNLERESLLDITDKTGGNYYYMFDFGMIPHVTTHILFNILNKCCNSSYATFTYEEKITEDNMKLITKYLDLYNYSVNIFIIAPNVIVYITHIALTKTFLIAVFLFTLAVTPVSGFSNLSVSISNFESMLSIFPFMEFISFFIAMISSLVVIRMLLFVSLDLNK